MEPVEVLKIKVSMPNAHFRVIHSNNPRRTYPVPPYSTVIGFLANLLGDAGTIHEMLDGTLALGMLSRFNYMSREYTWLRNLDRDAHIGRYFSPANRILGGVAEHPGGQSPISIEVLNEVEVIIYVYHSNVSILQILQQNIFLPDKWFCHTHLGRSEDWAIVESASMFKLNLCNRAAAFQNSDRYYQWMPDHKFSFGVNCCACIYKQLYKKVQGPAVLVTSVYRLVDVPFKNGLIGKIRNFEHIPARLFCSSIPFLDDFTLPSVLVDESLNVPVFMALINNKSDKSALPKEKLCGEGVQ